ncbi:MAG: NADH-quinone oxidoreductase subunit M [Planctomycetota bacterium]|nr:MAG: NADH-quinone oxidoreductase subunit M [Planctomycetota bacterium]
MTLLSLIVFLPALGALALAFFPREKTETIKVFSLVVTAVVFLLTVVMALPGEGVWQFDTAVSDMQKVFSVGWIPSFNIDYFMGVDGISFPLVLLTTFITMLSMAASWPIEKHVKAYCMLFLVLETGVLGVFLALDFFLFYVFWEVMLLPMYFLIGVWGGPRREYAAIKFFLYTLLGGVFMLIAILMLYFASDLKLLNKDQLVAAHVISASAAAEEQEAQLAEIQSADDPVHTFNILALQQLGQHTEAFNSEILGKSLQWWAFLLLLVGFVIKVPSVPVHTWLPDAHVEAPTPISMILAGILLKLGGYGIIRICYPICPQAGYDLAYFVCALGVVSMVYGAFAALAQKDFKRLVAYSSVSHMGYVVLGIGVWSAVAGNNFNPDAWKMGMNGAMFQMIAHGVASPGMFFIVGIVYERVHHRNLDQFGGLFAKMPVYSGLAFVIFFAGLGLPGLCGFIGEVFVTLSVWTYSHALAVVAASVVILTAAYILWTLQRVYLGPEYKGPHGDHLTPITSRELAIAVPIAVFAIVLGVYPQSVFRYMTPSVDQTVDALAAWTEREKPAGEETQTAQRPAVEQTARVRLPHVNKTP